MYPAGPVKLDDCTLHGAGSGAELIIVEGDSACGAVRRVRDGKFQALLPLQGKPLNPVKATAERVGAFPFYATLRDALGVKGSDGVDPAKCRYDRILLLMDPDADGIHCAALLMMYFYRWAQPLLEGGYVALIEAPMATIVPAANAAPIHTHTEIEYRRACDELRAQGNASFLPVRYRGLAGVDLAVLAQTCVDPDTRRQRKLGSADARAAMAVFGGG